MGRSFIALRFLKSDGIFSSDVLSLCWNFARNALIVFCFHVFPKLLKLFYWFAEFVLKLCKKCAQIFLFSRFLKNAETFQRICWICAETLWEKRRKKALNFFQDLYSKCAEILLFYIFSRALIFFYGCAEFVLKLCKKWAEILLFYIFSKALKFFRRMCWVCSETFQMRWNFIVFTFYHKCWNFSTDLLNLR